MAKEPENYYYEEEQGVSFFEFMGVLFGRKLLLLIVTASLFVASSLGIYLYNRGASTYEGTFTYSAKSLHEGKYIDGSNFDIRNLIKIDKLKEYQEDEDYKDTLSKLNMERVYRSGIVSLTHEITYLNNDTNEENKIVDKDFFKIVFSKKVLSFDQAQVLAEAIADEANDISCEIVDKADYSQQLKLYEDTVIFDKQVEYLDAQYRFLNEKYTNLIAEYGDVGLGNGLRVSDAQAKLKSYFGEDGFKHLKNELDVNGFVRNDESYKLDLEKKVEALKREKNVCENKRTALTDQINALLTGVSGGTVQSVEIEKYNEEIISLTNRICDIDEEIALLEIKINNIGREDEAYLASLRTFEKKLDDYYKALKEETTSFSTNEKAIVEQYSDVYFESNRIVTEKSRLSMPLMLVVAFAGSFIVALIVNLCLDGKKLTAKYRNEQLQNDKDAQ